MRVLLAEDNYVNQLLVVALLEGWGVSVEVVGDGLQALEALRKTRYDLVLMDIQMPGMDGLAATAQLRKPESGVLDPHVTVVALTAHAMREDRQRCLDGRKECFDRERFCQHARKRQAPVAAHALHVAHSGDPDKPDRRIERPQGRDQGRSVHLRHHHVGQHQLNFPPAFLEDPEGLGSACGGDHPVPEFNQRCAHDLADRGLVIHHEDAFAVGARPGRG